MEGRGGGKRSKRGGNLNVLGAEEQFECEI